MRTFLVLVLLMAFALPAPAAVYRCRDRKGVLVLTDDPENFPPGCRPEGKQGESASPKGGPTGPRPMPGAGPSPGAQPPRPGPEQQPPQPDEQLPAGSSGVAPGLNKPDPFAAPPEEEPRTSAPVQQEPESSARPDSQGISPQAQPWMEEARGLHQEYRELQTDVPANLAPTRRQDLENRIDAFYSRMEGSSLSPQDKAAVESALPPSDQ